MFKLEFKTDNAAFGKNQFARNIEIGRILRGIAQRIEDQGQQGGTARDINGSKVGEWEIT